MRASGNFRLNGPFRINLVPSEAPPPEPEPGNVIYGDYISTQYFASDEPGIGYSNSAGPLDIHGDNAELVVMTDFNDLGSGDGGPVRCFKYNSETDEWEKTIVVPYDYSEDIGIDVAITSNAEKDLIAVVTGDGVDIYERNSGSSDSWASLQTIPGFYYDVDFSEDGQVLFINEMGYDTGDVGETTIFVYRWNGTIWVNTPSEDINLPSESRRISCNGDGSVIAVALYASDLDGVLVYKWNGSTFDQTFTSSYRVRTVQIDRAGSRMIFVDGNSGEVLLFEDQEGTWTQIMSSEGTFSAATKSSVSISGDGKIVGWWTNGEGYLVDIDSGATLKDGPYLGINYIEGGAGVEDHFNEAFYETRLDYNGKTFFGTSHVWISGNYQYGFYIFRREELNPDLVSEVIITPDIISIGNNSAPQVINVTVLPESALDRTVTWSIEKGSEYIIIDSSDDTSATIRSGNNYGNSLIRVTSNQDNSIYSEIEIRVMIFPSITIVNPNSGVPADDQFGTAVAISENYILATAPVAGDLYGSGVAYIFNSLTGDLIHTIETPVNYSERFGNSDCDISEIYAVIAASWSSEGGSRSGKVYVYDAPTGILLHEINNPNPYGTGDNDYFGISVSVSEQYLIVGAHNEDSPGVVSSGKAYIYDPSSGELLHIINNPNPVGSEHSDYFGNSVSVTNSHAIVGAYGEDETDVVTNSGKAYIYDPLTGELLHQLDNPDVGESDSRFGKSVDLTDDFAFVGANGIYNDTGKLYVFDISTGGLLQSIDNPGFVDDLEDSYYATYINTSSKYSIVSASNSKIYTDSKYHGGMSFIYDTATRSLTHTLQDPNLSPKTGVSTGYPMFGQRVGISESHAVVSAYQYSYGDLDNKLFAGIVYVYHLATSDITGVTIDNSITDMIVNGETHQLTWTVLPGDAVDKTVRFASSDTRIAQVDSNGLLTTYGIDSGTVTITIITKIGGFKDSFSLNVNDLSPTHTLDNPDPDNILYFGTYVSLSDNYAMAGSTGGSGTPSLYNPSTGGLLYSLPNPNAVPETAPNTDGYGILSVSNNYAIVTAQLEGVFNQGPDYHSGKAYIFNPSTGLLIHTIDNPNDYGTTESDTFGSSVVISDTYAVVSAGHEDDAGGNESGKVYIFNPSNGALLHTLDNPNAYGTSQDDRFGEALALSSNHLIVGTPYEDYDGYTNSGKVYIFNPSNGALLHTLDNPNFYFTAGGDSFGYSVAISEKFAAVGSYSEGDESGDNSGKVYVYDVRTMNLLYVLDNPNVYGIQQEDHFGYSVAITDNHLIVGAHREDNETGNESGVAYIFRPASGRLLNVLYNPNPDAFGTLDYFGTSVSITNTRAMVGARGEDTPSYGWAGKAYIYDLPSFEVNGVNIDNPIMSSMNFGDPSYQLTWTVSPGGASDKSVTFKSHNTKAVEVDKNGLITIVSGLAGTHLVTVTTKVGKFDDSTAVVIDPLPHQFILDNPNPYGTSEEDRFGDAVSISDTYAIVGAYNEDEASGNQSGKAYIYSTTTGDLLHTLDNPNPYGTPTGDSFGKAVAISDTYAIISARYEDDASGNGSGKACIYDPSDGSLLYTLDNPNPEGTSTDDNFGNAVAISSNYAIVGAYQEDESGYSKSGKAYIYNPSTGDLLHTLNNPNTYGSRKDDYFGFSVSISNNYAIVGAYGEDRSGGTTAGRAYIFDPSNGSLLHTLLNPDPDPSEDFDYDYFGISVAISDTHAIVGAYGENERSGENFSGKAFIFDPSDGSLLHTINNPNPEGTPENDYFGRSVDISGNYAIVSAYNEGPTKPGDRYRSGKVYIYDVTTGTLVYTLDNPNPYGTREEDRFGENLSITNGHIIVASEYEDDPGGVSSGKVYLYELP